MTTIHNTETAVGMIRADHDLLLDRIDGLADSELAKPYLQYDGPLGHFCESLHDLVAHVLMWSEISLDVLHEARSRRSHWSIETRWETPEIGSALNRAGVVAGRELPGHLLVERFRWARDALAAEIASVPAEEWEGQDGVGGVLQRAMTPPQSPAYGHAARHLLGTGAVDEP